MFAPLSDVTRFQILDFRRLQKYARERLRSKYSNVRYAKKMSNEKMRYCGVLGVWWCGVHGTVPMESDNLERYSQKQ